MSRLNSRRVAKNRNEMYEKTFEDRGVKEVEQFSTPVFRNPSQEEIDRIPSIEHTWRNGDRFGFLLQSTWETSPYGGLLPRLIISRQKLIVQKETASRFQQMLQLRLRC